MVDYQKPVRNKDTDFLSHVLFLCFKLCTFRTGGKISHDSCMTYLVWWKYHLPKSSFPGGGGKKNVQVISFKRLRKEVKRVDF